MGLGQETVPGLGVDLAPGRGGGIEIGDSALVQQQQQLVAGSVVGQVGR